MSVSMYELCMAIVYVGYLPICIDYRQMDYSVPVLASHCLQAESWEVSIRDSILETSCVTYGGSVLFPRRLQQQQQQVMLSATTTTTTATIMT